MATAGTLIGPTDTWELWAALLACGGAGYYANRTKVGAALSGPVCAMLIAAVLSNVGVLPPPGPHISSIQSNVVKLATPLLLFRADLRRIAADTGRLLLVFGIGSVATALGATAACFLLSGPLSAVGAEGDGWKVGVRNRL